MINTELLNWVATRVSLKEMLACPEYVYFVSCYNACGSDALVVHKNNVFASHRLLAIYYVLFPEAVTQLDCTEKTFADLMAYLHTFSEAEVGSRIKQLKTEFMLGVRHD